jgi:hypothetical protein
MLPHNHLVGADFERQSRERIKQAADNSRLIRSNVDKVKGRPQEPVRKPFWGLGWLKGLRLNPAN